MTDVFQFALDAVLASEGGFVNDSNDPGGATNMGITLAVLSQWRDKPTTVDDVRSLTKDEATDIYKALYWDKVHGELLPPAVALLLFDAAVNHGVGTSIKLAQLALRVQADGVFGPQTLKALNNTDAREFVINFATENMLYYVNCGGWAHFGRGWAHRTILTAVSAYNFV